MEPPRNGLSRGPSAAPRRPAETDVRDQVYKSLLTRCPLTAGTKTNKSRMHFVARDDVEKLLDVAPDAEWRLLISLCRYGGLRCPSEVLSLKWEDVDFHESRILVRSPKTEHHEGGESRLIPMFPELVGPLLECWSSDRPPATYVIQDHRPASVINGSGNWANANLRTQLSRIVMRAGLTPWPKLWHNMRSSCQTELTESFPAHVVSEWLGNSVQVAELHYLQTTEEHFNRASGQKVLHEVLHSEVIPRPQESSVGGEEQAKTTKKATSQGLVKPLRMEDRGLEPLTFWLPARRSPS